LGIVSGGTSHLAIKLVIDSTALLVVILWWPAKQ